MKNETYCWLVLLRTSFSFSSWYVYQHPLFDFPFDEVYWHLLFFTLGSSVPAWIDYSPTKWKMKLLLFLLRLRYYYCCFLCVCSIAVPAVEKGYSFLFEEIHRRLLVFILGRSISEWIHYTTQMKTSSTTTWGEATDMIAGICTCPRLPCPCTKRHVMLNLTSTGVCNTGPSWHGWALL